MNLVCGPEGEASAVLLRAGEVVEGADLAATRRTTARSPRELARGPARLTVALGVTGDLDGADATDPRSHLTVHRRTPRLRRAIRSGPRVGVAGDGAARPWRFWLADEPTVSRYVPAKPVRKRAATR
jgi:DNA-3-methyladenine glycosylase